MWDATELKLILEKHLDVVWVTLNKSLYSFCTSVLLSVKWGQWSSMKLHTYTHQFYYTRTSSTEGMDKAVRTSHCNLWLLSPLHLLCTSLKNLASSSWKLLKHTGRLLLCPGKFSLLQAEQTQLSQPLFIDPVVQPKHLDDPALSLIKFINIFLVLQPPKLDVVFQIKSKECPVKKNNHFPQATGHVSVDTAQSSVGLHWWHTANACLSYHLKRSLGLFQ